MLILVQLLKSEVTHSLLDQMDGDISNLIEHVRRVSWELRPSVLDETIIYRIIQEGFTNIRKYAEVRLLDKEEFVELTIVDKGKGFNDTLSNRHVGLYSMEERAREIGGTLNIKTKTGQGTKIYLKIPTERK